jgi:hypothetical protein
MGMREQLAELVGTSKAMINSKATVRAVKKLT